MDIQGGSVCRQHFIHTTSRPFCRRANIILRMHQSPIREAGETQQVPASSQSSDPLPCTRNAANVGLPSPSPTLTAAHSHSLAQRTLDGKNNPPSLTLPPYSVLPPSPSPSSQPQSLLCFLFFFPVPFPFPFSDSYHFSTSHGFNHLESAIFSFYVTFGKSISHPPATGLSSSSSRGLVGRA